MELERLLDRGVAPAALKLRKWGLKGYIQYKQGSSLVSSLGSLGQYKRMLFCLGCSRQPRTLFQFICPHRRASWADSRGSLPVSYYMSLDGITLE